MLYGDRVWDSSGRSSLVESPEPGQLAHRWSEGS